MRNGVGGDTERAVTLPSKLFDDKRQAPRSRSCVADTFRETVKAARLRARQAARGSTKRFGQSIRRIGDSRHRKTIELLDDDTDGGWR